MIMMMRRSLIVSCRRSGLAASAPKTAATLATRALCCSHSNYSTQTQTTLLPRGAWQFVNTAASSSTGLRAFSSSQPQAAADALTDLLERELAEEVDNQTATAVPDELRELQQQLVSEEGGGWTMKPTSTAMTTLSRTIALEEGKTLNVELKFHCQDVVAIDDGVGYDDPDAAAEEGEEEEEPASPVRFTVTVQAQGGAATSTMTFTCLSENAAVRIQSVSLGNDMDENNDDYQGPDFAELAEDLQDAYYAFLEESCGVNEDVAAFVAMHSDFQEQKQYVAFLEQSAKLLR